MKTDRSNVRVGVVGVGTMGQHHVRVLSQMPGVVVSGLYDPDDARAQELCSRHGCNALKDLEELLDRSDAVTVAAPTSLHGEIGETCLNQGIHTLIEKPLAHNIHCAERLVELARRAGVVLMVGHIERYNPAIGKLLEILRSQPEAVISIEARRLNPFDGSRCLDVDVLYDLLIHDIDLALEIADSPIANVSVVGRPVFSQRTDTAHTTIEFENRTAAVFWTSKCSAKKTRSLTVATPSRCLEADTLANSLTVYTARELPGRVAGVCLMGDIQREEIQVPYEEPLRREINDFVRAIREGVKPAVDGERGLAALKALDLVARAMAEGVLDPGSSSG